MKRSPMKRSSPKQASDRKELEQLAHLRGGACEIGLEQCSGRANQLHHRLRRSQGGDNTRDNILAVCSPCHDWIHAHPAISYEKGWLVRSSA